MWKTFIKMLYLKLLLTFTVPLCAAESSLQSNKNEINLPTDVYQSFKTTKCSVSQINLELFEQLAQKEKSQIFKSVSETKDKQIGNYSKVSNKERSNHKFMN